MGPPTPAAQPARAARAAPLLAALLLACCAVTAGAVAAPPPAFPPAPAVGSTLPWFATAFLGNPTRAGHGNSPATFSAGAGALALATNNNGDILVADGPAVRIVTAGAVSTLYSNASLLFTAVCVDQVTNAVYALDSLTSGLYSVVTASGPALLAAPQDPLLSWWTACAVDGSGGVVVADAGLYRLLRVDPATGAQRLLAGCGVAAQVDGAGSAACVHEVYSLSYDAADNSTLLADYGNATTPGAVRRLLGNGSVVTVLPNLPFARAVLARPTSFHAMYTNLGGTFSAQYFPSTAALFPYTLVNWVPDLAAGAPPTSMVVSSQYSQAKLLTATARVIYFIGPPSPPMPPPEPPSPPLPNSPPPPEPPSPPVRAPARAAWLRSN